MVFEMADKRKAELYNEMLDWIAEHISDGDDLYLALRHIGMTDDEIKYEGFELYDNCDE